MHHIAKRTVEGDNINEVRAFYVPSNDDLLNSFLVQDWFCLSFVYLFGWGFFVLQVKIQICK